MAIGYVRVSTKGQAGDDRCGVEAQKAAILKYAKDFGYTITEFIVDKISGVKEQREGFDRILYGNIQTDAVIVYKSDRVARETKLYFYYLYTLEKKNIKLISVTEEFDEGNAMANIYRALLQFVAEQERQNIRARTMAGKLIKKMTGGYVGGGVPLGYMAICGKLYADPDGKKVVRLIYKLYSEGLGCTRITWELYTRKIKTKRGKDFSEMAVSRILKMRKFYEGFVLVDNEFIKGEQEAILKEGEFTRPDFDYFVEQANKEKIVLQSVPLSERRKRFTDKKSK